MPTIDAYLTFDGTCAEAMRFYEKALDAKLEMMMTNAQSPDPTMCPPGHEDRILHASLAIDGRRLMASDSMPGQPYQGMHGFGLALAYPTVAEARKVFDTLATGGRVDMPMQPTFWADAFGMVVDRYGTPWLINGGPRPMPS